MLNTKQCTRCKTIKDISEFNKNKAKEDGYSTECKPCIKIYADEYRRTKEGMLTHIYNTQIGSSKKRCHNMPVYSREELIEWAINNNKFNEIYSEWVESDYDTRLAPSIDRLDDYKGYSFDNIQVLTWRENNIKFHKDVRMGINNKQSRAVKQYTLDGEFIKEYHSIRHAGRELSISNSSIGRVCRGERSTSGGFRWCYVP